MIRDLLSAWNTSAAADPAAVEAAAVIAAFVLVALLLLFLFLGLALGRKQGRFEAERELPDILEKERADAVKRSRAVIGGQTAEQLAPYLPGFPFEPGDCRFVGKPVDFIVFSGASRGEIDELVFVEVKSGAAGLTRVERSLRDAIAAGKVRWAEYRAPV